MLRSKMFFLSVIASLALVLPGCAQSESTEAAPELLEPAMGTENTALAEYGTVYVYNGYTSTVIPKTEELSFSDGGELKEIYVTIGEKVTEGQVLADLKNSSEAYDELVKKLKDMQAENAAAARQRQIEIEIMKINLQDFTRQALIDRQKNELAALDENYLKGLIATEKEKLSASTIVAPFDGEIVAVGTNKRGEYIDEGVPFIVIASNSECFVYCDYISEKAIELYDKTVAIIDGDEFEITYVPYGEGVITKLMADEEDYYSIFKVERGGTALIGLPASIGLVKNVRENVLRVPVKAVHKENGTSYVYVDNNGTRQAVSVKTGVMGLMYAEITEGLKEGDVVYVAD
ncbi:MAG: efflux RND transporter periplasmic adaptor subunit [Lachnospiraceae bacterium]|nr:efflux RND transporter periplasmic adaptor subunit [Lachnospiraceae bacterium]